MSITAFDKLFLFLFSLRYFSFRGCSRCMFATYSKYTMQRLRTKWVGLLSPAATILSKLVTILLLDCGRVKLTGMQRWQLCICLCWIFLRPRWVKSCARVLVVRQQVPMYAYGPGGDHTLAYVVLLIQGEVHACLRMPLLINLLNLFGSSRFWIPRFTISWWSK